MKTESVQDTRAVMCPVSHVSFARIALTVLEATVYIALLWEIMERLPRSAWLPVGGLLGLFAACEHAAVRARLPAWEKAGIVAVIVLVAAIFFVATA